MNAKILEIFHSIQGEGKYVGVPQVFVRFFECNMHCVWCDTPASIGDGKREFKTYDLKQLLTEIKRQDDGVHSISITGGEPLLQADFIKEFAHALKKDKKRTYLDTNGTLPRELKKVIKDIDIIAMDIKLPSSTKQRAYWKEHQEFLKIAKSKELFIKTVISLDTDLNEVLKAAKLVAEVNNKIEFILQPNFLDIKKGVIDECVKLQKVCGKHLKDVRIIPQTHKFMKLR